MEWSDSAALPNYKVFLKTLSLRCLLCRKLLVDLTPCYRTIKREVKLPANKYWIFRTSSSRMNNFNTQCRKIHKKHFSYCLQFFYRCARQVSLLPAALFQARSVDVCGSNLMRVDLSQLLRIEHFY